MEYASLLKYITLFSDQVEQGTWIVDTKNDGSPEHPIQIPYVCYAEHVDAFIQDMKPFVDRKYRDTLERSGLKFETQSMENVNADKLGANTILALLTAAIRADRFCEGALLDFNNSGCILKWLKRLEAISGSSGRRYLGHEGR